MEGHPLAGGWRRKAQAFLAGLGLRMEEELDYSLVLHENGEMLATGSRRGNLLLCIGVSPARQGEGLAALLVTALIQDALAAGFSHLFLYTRPCNAKLFAGLGFWPVAQSGDVSLMENRRDGARHFVRATRSPRAPQDGRIGCIVANCNPFTKGHLYLAETAAARCDFLYFLVLSEDKSEFPATVRLRLAREGLAMLGNVQVGQTGPYLVSAATFPDYFVKDKTDAASVYYDIDIAVFGQCFAGALHIGTRFVGTEPRDAVTRGYNERMKALLPGYGVTVEDVARGEQNGEVVSAGKVRRLLREGKLPEVRFLVPPSTWAYLVEREGVETDANERE